MKPLNKNDFLANMTTKPGVYQMLDQQGKSLYVGKAKNLKKRVGSYYRQIGLSAKTSALMKKVDDIKLTITHNETEALLLESRLIKSLKPRYNVLLRDDKSYPYIMITTKHSFPLLSFYRGGRSKSAKLFGPYPSVAAVRETLSLLQKIFQLRQCSDSFFANRSTPCLQHQIKRCSAPCVDYISREDYAKNVKLAALFLQGKNELVITDLITQMELESKSLQYEAAAKLRDQITALRKVQQQQVITTGSGNADIVVIVNKIDVYVVHVLMIRSGCVIGGENFRPKVPSSSSLSQVLGGFMGQYYFQSKLAQSIPEKIIINELIEDRVWLAETLSKQAKHKVVIQKSGYGKIKQWLMMAEANANQAVAIQLSIKLNYYDKFVAVQKQLGLSDVVERIECFDVSHSLGESTVASCVVCGVSGPIKADYRRFNIKNVKAGDDYAALKQALMRRYTQLKQHEEKIPSLLLIDGGKGQLNIAIAVLEELQVTGVDILAVAKGPTRKPGMETLLLSGRAKPIELPADSIALHLIQYVRDESHRFAIMTHRKQRAAARTRSILEDIEGVGAKRRRLLLQQFGGLQGLKKANVAQISALPGMNKALAQRVYDYLQD